MTGPLAAPWTAIGRLQADVQRIEAATHRKVELHNIHTAMAEVSGVLVRLERAVEELRAEVAGVRDRLQTLEASRQYSNE